MNPWHDVSRGKKIPNEFNAVIEVQKGSMNKYELDKDTGLLRLDRVLYSPVHYPGNYGFVPQTLWEDDDPMDVLVLGNQEIYPMTIVEVRPIGILKMIDNKQEDDKIVGVPTGDPRFSSFKSLKDVPEHLLKEIKHFFKIYKELQGQKVKVIKWLDAKDAKEAVKKSIKMYEKKFK